MRKITFENLDNGLSCEFSSETPLMLLESFDGCSCGSDDIVYKPINFDGQRFISSNLSARTVQFTANFGGKTDDRYSRKAALSRWQEIQKVFIPGKHGRLTWTDGANERYIDCRVESTPLPEEMLPFLFRIKFQLTADKPLWFETTENVVELASGSLTATIDNDCGIAVPFVVEADSGANIFTMISATTGAKLGFINNSGQSFTIDTAECTVKNASGELCNNLLSVDSEFFDIVPGVNRLNFAGSAGVRIRWRRAYMGVF